MMRLLALVLTTAALSGGCFFEARGGFYPRMTSELKDEAQQLVERKEGVAFTVAAALGVWIDLYGVGLGITGDSANGMTPVGDGQLDGDLQQNGTLVRVDVDLPVDRVFLDGYVKPRLTYATDLFNSGIFRSGDDELRSEESSGRSHYLGLTMAAPGGMYSASLGLSTLEYLDESGRASLLDPSAQSVQVSAYGAEARVIIGLGVPGFLSRWRSAPIESGQVNSSNEHTTVECTHGFFGRRCVESSSRY